MKTIKLLLGFSLLTFHFSLSFGQSWNWAKAGYSSIKPGITALVATNETGDAYVAGVFQDVLIFEPDTLIAHGSGFNAYLAKYNSSGQVKWSTAPYSVSGVCPLYAVATDISGYIYITGTLDGQVTFGTFTLNPPSNTSPYYLVKYDPSGHVVWAKIASGNTSGSGSFSVGYGVTSDKSGHEFVTGYFSDTLIAGTHTLVAYPSSAQNIFIAKYDTAGNVLWAQQAIESSASSGGIANSVTADDSGNCYITGNFYGMVTFGSTTLISSASPYGSVFLVKYSPSGNMLWATQSTNGSMNSDATGYSVITDNQCNPYITGVYQDTVNFGAQTLTAPPGYTAFFVKYSSSGNLLWAESSSPGWEGTSLSADTRDNIYLAGNASNKDTIKFRNYSIGTNPTKTNAAFLIKFDTSGNGLCGSIVGSLGCYYVPVSVASNSTGNDIYLAGVFCDTIFYNNDTIQLQGYTNVFTGSWKNCANSTNINQLKVESGELKVFPNPFTNTTTILLTSYLPPTTYHYLELDDLTGRTLKSIEFIGDEYTLSAEGLAKGMYFVRVFDSALPQNGGGDMIGTSKIVIQ